MCTGYGSQMTTHDHKDQAVASTYRRRDFETNCTMGVCLVLDGEAREALLELLAKIDTAKPGALGLTPRQANILADLFYDLY